MSSAQNLKRLNCDNTVQSNSKQSRTDRNKGVVVVDLTCSGDEDDSELSLVPMTSERQEKPNVSEDKPTATASAKATDTEQQSVEKHFTVNKQQQQTVEAKQEIQSQQQQQQPAAEQLGQQEQTTAAQQPAAQQRQQPFDAFSDTIMREYMKWLAFARSLLRNRWWTSVNHFIPAGGRRIEFTVASYNVLSQDLLEDHRYLYSYCTPEFQSWQYRSKNLLDELRHYRPDIICLQEVFRDHFFEFFRDELKGLGYDGIFKKRTGPKNDGCAIFYKTQKFFLERYAPVEFYQPGVELLDRDNVAIVALLKCHQAGDHARLCVATTHLLFNPRRGDVKLAQLVQLLAEIERHSFVRIYGRPCYHPVIFCGDLNLQPFSDLYKFITNGVLHYRGKLIRTMSGQREGHFGKGAYKYFTNMFLPRVVGITDNCQYVDTLKQRLGFADSASRLGDDPKTGSNRTDDPKTGSNLTDEPKTGSNRDEAQPVRDQVSCPNTSVVDAKDGPSENLSTDEKTTPGSSVPVSSLSSLVNGSCDGVSTASCSSDSSSTTQQAQGLDSNSGSSPVASEPTFSHNSGVLRHWFNFGSVYTHEAESTTCHGESNCTVDYIFYSRTQSPNTIHLRSRLNLLSPKDMNGIGGLPNQVVSSDHVLLMSRFQLRLTCDEKMSIETVINR